MYDMGRTVGVFLLSVMFAIPLAALDGKAQPNQKPLAFEVASIKPNTNSDIRQRGIQPLQPGGLFRSAGLTLQEYIRVAYGQSGTLLLEQVTGGPSWVATERFDITAKVEDFRSVADPNQYVLTMLRALLVDRFKLTLHTEQRQRAIYDLVVLAPDRQLGPRLRRTTEPCVQIMATQTPADVSRMCGVRRVGPGLFSSTGTPMSWLAVMLSQRPEINRVVHDRTNLAGDFDVDLEFQPWTVTPGSQDSVGAIGASIFTALQEQLGLKLESTNGLVDVLVVDRVERPSAD
jgi:uncharacterized protein (TIGR03435 family)